MVLIAACGRERNLATRTTYKKRHWVEYLFAKIQDWRRIRTRYDRRAHVFMSAVYIAATAIFWRN
jgi:transposase